MTDMTELSLTKPDLGQMLSQARQAKGLAVEEMAARLRIRRAYLEALEKNDFNALPGLVYGIGFIRSYARALDLNEVDIVAMYKNQNGVEAVKPKYEARMPKIESRIPGGIPLVIGAVVAAGIFVFWYMTHSEVGNLSSRISDVPEPLAAAIKQEPGPIAPLPPTPLAVVPPSTAPTSPNTASGIGQTDKNLLPLMPLAPNNSAATGTAPPPLAINQAGGGAKSAQAPAQAPAQPPAAPPAATLAPANIGAVPPLTNNLTGAQTNNTNNAAKPTPAKTAPEKSPNDKTNNPPAPAGTPLAAKSFGNGSYGAPDGRIVFTATEDSWIEIISKDNNTVIFSRLLKTGESYHVPTGRTGLLMSTGNAGGLAVTVDSKTAPVLGASGVVRHEIDLSADKLLNGTAVPKATRKKNPPNPANPPTEAAPIPKP
ncbi:MAG: DUF4115 domain-containing protein [Candidatus Symbiobacter sp.]|nr:DUF4115 domain-containing protein [Candidatus Symbiobacter sp.]